MDKRTSDSDAITFADRIGTAILSAIFAAIALVVFLSMRHFWSVSRPTAALYRDIVSSGIAWYFIGGAATLGFLLGPKGMSAVFDVLWGTGDPDNSKWRSQFWLLGFGVIVGLIVRRSLHHRAS